MHAAGEVRSRRSRRGVGRAARIAAALGVAGAALVPSAAFAVEYPTGGNPPTDVSRTGAQTSPASTSRGSSLPFTGGDVAGLAAMGAAAVLGGGLMLRHGRRSRIQG
jgi:hypothetical protein